MCASDFFFSAPARAFLTFCFAARTCFSDAMSATRVFEPVLESVAAGGVPRAVGAAEELAVRLDAVADDLAAAVLAHRGHLVDRTLEAVEGVPRAGRDHLERLVVLIATDFTRRHGDLLVVGVTLRLPTAAPP